MRGEGSRRSQEPHAARLGRYRDCARLYRAAVRRGELRRPAARTRPRRQAARPDLPALPRDLLHLLDLFRLGRSRLALGLRLPDDLCRADPDDRALLSADPADRAARQSAEHHLDRRLHRRALRQAAGGGGDRRADRDRRNHSLYRPAIESGVVVGRHDFHACLRQRDARHLGDRRHLAVGRLRDGGFRHPVRHAPYRRDRTSGWFDARDRDGIDRQARGVPRGRHVRDVLDVRRAGRFVLAGAEPS